MWQTWAKNDRMSVKQALILNIISHHMYSLSGVSDFFDRNKILSGGDLSHYQVPHCIRVFFILFDLCIYLS